MEDFELSATDFQETVEQERFRDACKYGDVDGMNNILRHMSIPEQQKLIHRSKYPCGSPLFEAILNGSIIAIKRLIDLKYQLEREYNVCIFEPIVFEDRCPALCLACAYGNKEIVKLLLSSGSLVNHCSENGSPIFYANQFFDPAIINLLLSGSQQNDQYKISHFLQEACLMGHGKRAELFMKYSNEALSDEKKVCFLGMLGAQCINLREDYSDGVKYWKEALNLLSSITNKPNSSLTSINDILKELKVIFAKSNFLEWSLRSNLIIKNGFVSEEDEMRLKQRVDVFGDMQLCTNIHELESFAEDKKRLCVQAFIVLKAIFGISNEKTLRQTSKIAEIFVKMGDVESACLIILHTIEAIISLKDFEMVSEMSSKLCEYLLNYFKDNSTFSSSSFNHTIVKNIIITATEFLVKNMIIIHESLYPNPNLKYCSKRNINVLQSVNREFNMPSGNPRKVGIFTQMVETFMGFIALLMKLKIQEQHPHAIYEVPNRSDINNNDYHNGELFEETSAFNEMKRNFSNLISMCHQNRFFFLKFNFESDMVKLAISRDRFAMSTLNLFKEDLFPRIEVLDFLISCGVAVNCIDTQGNTGLHYSLDCSKPDIDIVKKLLHVGADVDVRNCAGITPYKLLLSLGDLSIYPFNYTTLKCLSTLSIIKHNIDFMGQLPKILERFVIFHSIPLENH